MKLEVKEEHVKLAVKPELVVPAKADPVGDTPTAVPAAPPSPPLLSILREVAVADMEDALRNMPMFSEPTAAPAEQLIPGTRVVDVAEAEAMSAEDCADYYVSLASFVLLRLCSDTCTRMARSEASDQPIERSTERSVEEKEEEEEEDEE